jgi:hypothetical protein
VVGACGQERGTARLIYGELRNGQFAMRWDSPLLKAFFWGLGYEDLDGDKTKEIVFRSDLSRDGRFYSIFDVTGKELTRQQVCETDTLAGFDEHSGVCPILCEGIDIQPPGADRKRDLIVYGKSDAPRGTTVRMRLVNGRFVVVPTRRR